jgi:tripartite-type tricarboxylate transporter receptor subunit TctC
MNFRTIFVLAAVTLVVAATGAQAQAWPNRPVRIIIPYPPGDAADIMARLIGPKMSERLGQPVVVENRAGASGQIGLDVAAHATPDGYTLAVGQGGNLAVAPHTYKKLAYDPLRDFVPVAMMATNYLAIIANIDTPFKTAGELVAWAKANPGKLTVGTNGEGGLPHLSFEMLRTMAGFTFTHVPYKGASQTLADIVGGQLQLAIGSYTSLAPQVQSGRVRLIAITNPVRDPRKPELPVAADAVPGYGALGWFGFVAPAGTPQDIVLRLNDAINRAMNSPEIAEKMAAGGLSITAGSPEYFGEVMRNDYARFGKLVRDIGFQPQ